MGPGMEGGRGRDVTSLQDSRLMRHKEEITQIFAATIVLFGARLEGAHG
jgi:hypothetical protein